MMADTRRPIPPPPPVRLRPAPPLDPPFADEPSADPWPRPLGGQLTLDLPGPDVRGRSRPTGRPGVLRPAPAGPSRTSAAPPPPATSTPEATRAAHRFVGMCLEILNGYRPVGQIRPLSDPTQAATVIEQLARAATRVGPVRRRSTRPAVRLRRLRAYEPRCAAVEVTAVLSSTTGRSWAMALRLERRRGSWICTAMQVL